MQPCTQPLGQWFAATLFHIKWVKPGAIQASDSKTSQHGQDINKHMNRTDLARHGCMPKAPSGRPTKAVSSGQHQAVNKLSPTLDLKASSCCKMKIQHCAVDWLQQGNLISIDSIR